MKTILAALVISTAVAPAATYDIDGSHSRATFKVRHLMISNVQGAFRNIAGRVEYDPKNVAASRIDVKIDAASINTQEAKRDDHLKSPDFFDVAKYPSITFQSGRAEKGPGGAILVHGELTIHGVTKPVTLKVEGPTPEMKDPWGATRVAATARTEINRKDFGLLWNKNLDGGGVLVGDQVTIEIEVELVRSTSASGTE